MLRSNKQARRPANYEHINFVPPEGVRMAAQRGLAWRKEHGYGGTAVGVARARDLSNGKRLSVQTVKRMRSFFARHGRGRSSHYELRDNKPTPWRVAWDLWGGDAGRTWSERVVNQMQGSDTVKQIHRSVNSGASQTSSKPPETLNEGYTTGGVFTVYKQADEQYRWFGISSTAYEDRDGEIISTEALAQVVKHNDATGERGPLRYWHVPGVELGTCDFQATLFDNRALLESGIITEPVIAEKLASTSKQWGLTIGFYHPLTEPDAQRVFRDIYQFERSVAPNDRVSNRFTRLLIGDKSMPAILTPEKEQKLKELVGDDQELLERLLGPAEQTDKEAQRRYAYKAAQEEQTATTKQEESEVEVEVEDEPVLSARDIEAIAEAVAKRLAMELDGMMEQAMKIDDELKARGFQRVKEQAEQSEVTMKEQTEQVRELKKQLATLSARLKELEGDQPAAQPVRPTEQEDTLTERVKTYNTPEEAAADWLFGNGGLK